MIFEYSDNNGEKFLSEDHLLSARELCQILNLRRNNGAYPVKLMKEFLEKNLKLKRYYYTYIPNLNRRKVVYNLKNVDIITKFNSFILDRQKEGIYDDIRQ